MPTEPQSLFKPSYLMFVLITHWFCPSSVIDFVRLLDVLLLKNPSQPWQRKHIEGFIRGPYICYWLIGKNQYVHRNPNAVKQNNRQTIDNRHKGQWDNYNDIIMGHSMNYREDMLHCYTYKIFMLHWWEYSKILWHW